MNDNYQLIKKHIHTHLIKQTQASDDDNKPNYNNDEIDTRGAISKKGGGTLGPMLILNHPSKCMGTNLTITKYQNPKK